MEAKNTKIVSFPIDKVTGCLYAALAALQIGTPATTKQRCNMTKQITWNSNDPSISYLENNGLVKDANNNLYAVDRKNGYILNLLQLNENFFATGFKSVNVDPSSFEYDSENEYFTHEINGCSTFYELLKSKN